MTTFITLVFFILSLWIFFSIVIWTVKNGISPMPSSIKAKDAILEIIPENSTGTIYELGSGWGTLAFPVADKLSNYKIIGIENSPFPYYFSKIKLMVKPRKNVEFLKRNFLEVNLGDAHILICYLYPGVMRKLKEKFENELKPGTFVVTNTFTIPGWNPVKIIEINDLYHTKIYLYQL